MRLVGYRKSSFKTKDTGELIEGYNLYLVGKDEKVEGEACERVFLTTTKMGDYAPIVGDELKLEYNRFGKVASVEVH